MEDANTYWREVGQSASSQGDTARLHTQVKLHAQVKSGAGWFYWIAGLSAINTVVFLMGSDWAFVAGLGLTMLVDVVGLAFATELGDVAKYAAVFVDVIILGVVALFGYLAGRRQTWAFIVGMALYGLDSLLVLWMESWISFGFHLLALYYLFAGLRACIEANRLEQQDRHALNPYASVLSPR
jgi:hypothetical protein